MTPSLTTKSRPLALRWLGALALGCFAAALALELGVRFATPSLAWLDVLVPSPEGYSARAGFAAAYEGTVVRSPEPATFTTVAGGLRGPVGLVGADVVAIGSSYTFGLGSSDGGTWPAQLGRLRSLKVANAGLPGRDVAMAAATLRRFGERLRGRTVLWALQSDDLRRTPAQAWLGVRAGAGAFSAAVAWWRARQVPTGRALLADERSAIDATAVVASAAAAARQHGYTLVLIRLSAWGDGTLGRHAASIGLRVIDISAMFERLVRDDAMRVVGDVQLNALGNRALAATIDGELRLTAN